MLHRRNIFKAMLASAGAVFTVGGARAAEGGASKKLKVAYHLSDLDKVQFVLGNIKNHIEGVGGPQNVEIVLVVHGPALKGFHAVEATEPVSKRVADFSKAGVKFAACGNTMDAQHVKLDDLTPGFEVAKEGGVTKLAELQSQGYVYLRP